MITQEINVYMDVSNLPDIRMVAGDVGRMIYPYVYTNRNADEPLDLTTYELRIILIKPDKTFVIADFYDGAIELPEQAGAVTGRGYYQLRISKSGEEIYTGQGNFIVDDYILNDSMVESIAEVNGYEFPDDFLTQGDIPDLSDYYTKEETDAEISAAISGLATYSQDLLYGDPDSWTYVDFWPASPQTVHLAHPYTDYTMLILCVSNANYGAYMGHIPVFVPAIRIYEGTDRYSGLTNVGMTQWSSPTFKVVDSTHLTFNGLDSGSHMRLYRIYGLKWS